MYLISPYILQSLSITAYRRLTNNSKVITTWQTHQGTRSIITETSLNHAVPRGRYRLVHNPRTNCIVRFKTRYLEINRGSASWLTKQLSTVHGWRKLDAWDVWIANSRATTGRRSFGDYVKAAASMIWPLSLSGFTNSRPRPSDSTARY